MNALSILLHISALIHFGHDVQAVVKNISSKQEKWPSKDEMLKLLEDAAGLISGNVFGFPDDVNKQIVEVIDALKEGLSEV